MGRDSRLRRERRTKSGGRSASASRAPSALGPGAEAPVPQAIRLIFDFFNDLRDHAAAELKTVARSDVDPGWSVRDVIYAWANYRHHRIEVRPRQVHWSRELRAATVDPKILAGIQRIESTALAGGDLNPFQTTLLVNFNRKDKQGEDEREGVKHRDGMLLDWGITHMHLGPPKNNRLFVKRSGKLLFVTVRRDALYMLTVEDHVSFSKDAVLETVHKNWPQLLDSFRLPAGVVGFEDAFAGGVSAQERTELRESMVIPVQMSDGTMYFAPGGGVTTAGSSAIAIDRADALLRSIQLLETQVRTNEAAVIDFFKSAIGTASEIKLIYNHKDEAIRESLTGLELPLHLIGLQQTPRH